MKLILGSSSASRQTILNSHGIAFEIVLPDIDEKAIRFEDPATLVAAIAEAKMDAVLTKLSEPAFVVTSDQVTVSDGRILEKPVSTDEAREYLIRHRTIPPKTMTAVCVTNSATGQRARTVDIATTFFTSVPDELIDHLINDGRVMHCSGAFVVNDPMMKTFVDHIDRTVDSVEGLPFEVTIKLLKEVGYTL